jgi:NTP pyrophosphatase (non-canonical NTP hydrolase)
LTGSDRRTPAAPARPANAITLAGFQQLIRDRYFATDNARGTPGTFMWFIEEVGELSTALSDTLPGKKATQAQRTNLEEEFADVLAWLCTLANIHGVDLERAVSKYTDPTRVKGVKD